MNRFPPDADWRRRTSFQLRSEPGNERIAMQRVADAVADLDLPSAQVEQLKTAVAEATMNAIEHGNKNNPSLPVDIEVHTSDRAVMVRVTDQGTDLLELAPQPPDLEAKLAGLQSPRGWGLFLIKNMVDEMRIADDSRHNTIELIFYREGVSHGSEAI